MHIYHNESNSVVRFINVVYMLAFSHMTETDSKDPFSA